MQPTPAYRGEGLFLQGDLHELNSLHLPSLLGAPLSTGLEGFITMRLTRAKQARADNTFKPGNLLYSILVTSVTRSDKGP